VVQAAVAQLTQEAELRAARQLLDRAMQAAQDFGQTHFTQQAAEVAQQQLALQLTAQTAVALVVLDLLLILLGVLQLQQVKMLEELIIMQAVALVEHTQELVAQIQ
jgi:hypothetical protein